MILREMLTLYMRVHEIGQRELARQLEMSPATLCRFIQGKQMDVQNTVKLLAWMTRQQPAKGEGSKDAT